MAADWLAYTPGEPAGVARRKMYLPLLLPRVPSPALRRGAKPLWRRWPTVCIRRQRYIAAAAPPAADIRRLPEASP